MSKITVIKMTDQRFMGHQYSALMPCDIVELSDAIPPLYDAIKNIQWDTDIVRLANWTVEVLRKYEEINKRIVVLAGPCGSPVFWSVFTHILFGYDWSHHGTQGIRVLYSFRKSGRKYISVQSRGQFA